MLQGQEDLGSGQALGSAAQVSIANGDLARGRIFAKRAASVWKTALGSDSKRAINQAAIARNPSSHELYGFSMLWKTTVDEVPQGLWPDDFEDWLWRRSERS
ncbi:hypothetical protein E4U55_006151 [Claviceps digitariae]|nr:hypothetical protein E4U55_006151 [Claviceps digitariae]